MQELGDALGGQGLSCARRTVKDGDKALALALDNIVDGLGGVEFVGFDKSADDGFLVGWEDQGVEGGVVVFDFADAGDGKLQPELLGEGKAVDDGSSEKELFVSEVVFLASWDNG